LARRIGFTLGALLMYRLGSYIPLPASTPRPPIPGGDVVTASRLSILRWGFCLSFCGDHRSTGLDGFIQMSALAGTAKPDAAR